MGLSPEHSSSALERAMLEMLFTKLHTAFFEWLIIKNHNICMPNIIAKEHEYKVH